MKKNPFAFSLVLLFFATIFTGCKAEKKDNQPVDAGPEVAKQVEPASILENDFVKVVAVGLAPGEALTAHQGEERLVYSLSDYTIEWKQDGQDPGSKEWKRGDVHVHKPGEHSAVNNGSSRAEWVIFVKKTDDLPVCEEMDSDKIVTALAGDAARLLYDDANFRVTEISLDPGESIPEHRGMNRIIYSLSDYTIRYRSDKSEVSEKSYSKGEAHWHEGCQHSVENTGTTEARFLVVAFKENSASPDAE